MSKRIGLSKSRLLSFHQCPRRLWLEQHSPELAETSADVEGAFATGNVVGEVARYVYGRGEGHYVRFDGGLRRAIETTRELLANGGGAPIFEATFEYDSLVVRTDIFDRSEEMPRIVEVKASKYVADHQVLDCAIQAWTLQQLGFTLRQVAVAHVDREFVYQGDGRYEELFVEEDVTELVKEHFATVPRLVEQARATLAAAVEPTIDVGAHCSAPYSCPFYDHCAPPQGEYRAVAESSGFSLHAGIAAKASQRDKLEHLARYVARPPVATERPSLTESGQVRCALKTPYGDGTTHVIFEPEDFIARLAALVPKPRASLTRYHGVFAPASPDRSRIVPGSRAAAANQAKGCGEPSASDRHRAMTWAQRLKRVFAIDIETCRSCGGQLRVIASIEEPAIIERILGHLGGDGELSDPANPSRAPPQADLLV